MLAYKSDSCVLHLLFDLILSFKSLNLDSLLVIFAYTGPPFAFRAALIIFWDRLNSGTEM